MSREGKVLTQLEALLNRDYRGSEEEHRRKLFSDYDGDSDGKIDSDELSTILADADVGNRFTRGAWVRGVMKSLDADGDDKIDWNEFETAISKVEWPPPE